MNLVQHLPLILGVEAVISCVVAVYLIWTFKLKTVYRAVFYRQVQVSGMGSKQVLKVAQKDFKPSATSVNYEKNDYPILFDKMAYTDGRKHVWAFDLDEKIGLTFGGKHDIGDPQLVGGLLYSGLLKRFANMVNAIDTTVWILIIALVVVALLSFVSGLFASPYILPPTNSTVPLP